MIKFVMTAITIAMINRLKNRIAHINRTLHGEQIYVYETNTQYCVIALVNTTTHQILAKFAVNVHSRRDICLAKSFIGLIELTRVSKHLPQLPLTA